MSITIVSRSSRRIQWFPSSDSDLASVWAMARRRPKEYRRRVNAATPCSGVCPYTWPDVAWPDLIWPDLTFISEAIHENFLTTIGTWDLLVGHDGSCCQQTSSRTPYNRFGVELSFYHHNYRLFRKVFWEIEKSVFLRFFSPPLYDNLAIFTSEYL